MKAYKISLKHDCKFTFYTHSQYHQPFDHLSAAKCLPSLVSSQGTRSGLMIFDPKRGLGPSTATLRSKSKGHVTCDPFNEEVLQTVTNIVLCHSDYEMNII